MAIEYKTLTYRTVESTNDNATYCWVELSASHVPAVDGLIKRIVIQGATTSASGMTTDPMYLGVWERQDDGGLIFLGCSKNAIVQAINQQSVWDFDGAIIRGKSLLLGLLSSPDEHWTNNTQLLLRSRVQTNDTDGCVILTNIGRLRVTPDITFTVEYPEYIPDEEPEPTPELEERRVVDISKYWIQIIRNTNEFKQIATAENPEFNDLLGAIYRALKDAFILEATEYGVSRWEKILGLVVTEGMTLDERKVQILNYLSVKLPYTWRVLKEMLNTVLGEGNYTMSLDNDTQTLHMGFTLAVWQNKKADVESLLKRVLPMNLVVDILVDGVPAQYTQLEYLENSGTQYISIPEPFTTGSGVNIAADYSLVTEQYRYVWYLNAANNFSIWMGNTSATTGMSSGLSTYSEAPNVSLKIWNKGYNVTYWTNWLNDNLIALNVGDETQQQEITQPLSYWNTPNQGLFANMKANGSFNKVSCSGARILLARFSQGSEITRDLVPVLDANGTPCMYDKITRKCFYNSGSGTFGYRLKVSEGEAMQLDLDDPYYTAPSGVWAKLIAENELDIIADTDMKDGTTQGYKWFANTGEAYQYFNIVEEVIENE